MDVDSINRTKGGKDKGKEKGKDKSKTKEKGKTKNKDKGAMGQGKGQSKDAGRKPEARACHYCGKIGHLAADCRKKGKSQ
eukprot:4263159-Amphidinium_carterae.1